MHFIVCLYHILCTLKCSHSWGGKNSLQNVGSTAELLKKQPPSSYLYVFLSIYPTLQGWGEVINMFISEGPQFINQVGFNQVWVLEENWHQAKLHSHICSCRAQEKGKLLRLRQMNIQWETSAPAVQVILRVKCGSSAGSDLNPHTQDPCKGLLTPSPHSLISSHLCTCTSDTALDNTPWDL